MKNRYLLWLIKESSAVYSCFSVETEDFSAMFAVSSFKKMQLCSHLVQVAVE